MKSLRISQAASRQAVRFWAIVPLSIVLCSCNHGRPGASVPNPGPIMHQGLSIVDTPNLDTAVAGQTIYVPAYSSIYISDRADRFNLAITLAVRNTDLSQPIVITRVRYLGQAGYTVRDFLEHPIRVAPLAAAGFFVPESDISGGALTSFLVEWIADQPVNSPIAESAMVGVGGTQGVSFFCQGRVIADRQAPTAAPNPRSTTPPSM